MVTLWSLVGKPGLEPSQRFEIQGASWTLTSAGGRRTGVGGVRGLCCWLVFQPLGKADVLPPVELAQSSLEGQLEGIDSSQVEALVIDRRGIFVEIGLLLSTIEIRRAEGGFSQFESELFNLGNFPVENARVELRLLDRQERFIETIVLATDEALFIPKRWAHLEGMYQVGALSPRIVEERLALFPFSRTRLSGQIPGPTGFPISCNSRWMG